MMRQLLFGFWRRIGKKLWLLRFHRHIAKQNQSGVHPLFFYECNYDGSNHDCVVLYDDLLDWLSSGGHELSAWHLMAARTVWQVEMKKLFAELN